MHRRQQMHCLPWQSAYRMSLDGCTSFPGALSAIADASSDYPEIQNAVNGINQQIQLTIGQTALRDKINGAATSITTATANATTLKSELENDRRSNFFRQGS